MKTLDLIKKTSAYLKHIAPALAVGACLVAGNANAFTTTTVIDLGAFNTGGTHFNGGALVKKINLNALPPGSILRTVTMNYRLAGGNPYLGDLIVLFADNSGDNGILQIKGQPNDNGEPKSASTTLPWNSGSDYNVGVTATQTLTAADGVLPIDLNNYAIWLQTGYGGTWEGSVTLEYDVAKITLNTPADNQAYPSGTSITATANVVVEAGTTDAVTFHTTPVSPAGATFNTVSTDTSSPYTAVLGVLSAGTYSINATVTSTGSFPGTSTSTTHTFTVAPAVSTTTTLAATSDSTYGQSVTFTATVAPTPTGGTVQFYDGGSPLGTPVSVDTGTGEASFSVNSLDVATHTITATYSGQGVYLGSTSAAVSQVVDKAQLTVQALNTLRAPNTGNPDPLPYQITGYRIGQTLATSGVTGTPSLSTTAIVSSPVGDYPITAALGDLAASNYSFTFIDGTLTVAVVADTFSVNFYAYPGPFSEEDKPNVLVPTGVPAGKSGWFTSGWLNYLGPFGTDSPLPPVALTSNKGSAATFQLKDLRNAWAYSSTPRTTLLGDGNGNMMDGHLNGTLEVPETPTQISDMEVTDIPFAVYDVIFYMGGNLDQFGDGKGKIVFNGGAPRDFTVIPGRFDGSFTEMVDGTTPGNYIVFPGVTGTSFTTQVWGNGFNHLGPYGFQIKEAAAAGGYSAWQTANNTAQTLAQDLDNDGVSNGIEYFIYGPAANSSFTALPSVVNTGGVLSVTFTHAAGYTGAYGTDFRVETSTTLAPGSWTAATLSATPNIPDTYYISGNNVTYTFPSGPTKTFARLKVTGP